MKTTSHILRLLFLFMLAWLPAILAVQLPIVLVHGIMADKHAMGPTINFIEKYLPGTYIKSVNIGIGKYSSWWNMYDQAEWLAHEIQSDKNLRDGFIMIAHSQGGLLGRYYLEHYNNPHVHTYISWGSPQQGVFGMPGTLDNRFTWLNLLENYTYKLMYTELFQKYVGFASYWHDPFHTNTYLKKCSFLPYLNNEIMHEMAATYKENVCSLHAMVLVKSTNDDIIEPLESCHFEFYKEGSKHAIVPLEESALYTEDHLGLKTLAETGRLFLKTASCTHTNFQEDESNFIENTLPYLTA
jgi:palmitoyl-protein thioesterase